MGGTVWFPTTFEWSEAEREYPPQRPAQAAVAVGHGAFVGEPWVPTTFEWSEAKREFPPAGVGL